MTQLITVASFRDLPLAELAKSKLESEGISCFLVNKYHIGMNWSLSFALGGVKVQVRAEDSGTALKLLNEDQSDLISEIENDFSPLSHDELCSNCGSSKLELRKAQRNAGAFSLLLGFPFIIFLKRYKCRDCGHIQKVKSK